MSIASPPLPFGGKKSAHSPACAAYSADPKFNLHYMDK
ncbi:Hypothetical protein ETEE_2071 [Edwardsiella anguillarum ET080813]|uniref:Uncharacterized protein n=1 Tax=Edwardsiella anguillarum ET080813 TaxID=667120 RepID=A0A076LKY1_9GAMM|nr:Hypothetical protein ETEE_2071 [Edwardsiella anguillarum ET080813]